MMAESLLLQQSFSEVVQSVSGLMYTMLFESRGELTEHSRFSYVAFSPLEIIKTVNKKTVVIKDESIVFETTGSPFDLLESKLEDSDVFEWGGFLTYESCRFFTDYPFIEDDSFPAFVAVKFKHRVVYDRMTSEVRLYTDDSADALARINAPSHMSQLKITQPIEGLSYKEYCKSIEKIKAYISAGDVYQINYTYPVRCSFEGDLFLLYKELSRTSSAPYSSFIRTPETCVISNSPELFIAKHGDSIYTKPIKGTRPRGKTPDEDDRYKYELQTSLKDRAELLMIVDLERNDLNRICTRGSVHVGSLFDIDAYSYVYQQSASISGVLKTQSLSEMLEAVFPGGSITGAPKIRAMELIGELEESPRRIYTGGIGLFSKRRMVLNIAIRTLYTVGSTLVYHVGGGIVSDSEPDKEWQETQTKGSAIRAALDFFSLGRHNYG